MITRIKDIVQGKASLNSTKRSAQWVKVRKEHLKQHSLCEVCGSKTNLNVHHIKPYHSHPELELTPENLITLCENTKKGINCHLLIGHLGNYKKINPHCIEDAKIWCKKLN